MTATNLETPPVAPGRSRLRVLWDAWNNFFFTPRDPTGLGLVRIGAGLVALYTLLGYSFDLQEFFGETAWNTLVARRDLTHNGPVPGGALNWEEPGVIRDPETPEVRKYIHDYVEKWHVAPPKPYPSSPAQAERWEHYHKEWGIDPRMGNLPLPETEFQENYVKWYLGRWGVIPPPPYPSSIEEANEFDAYHKKWGIDPRQCYTRGTMSWSIWFHVTDPVAMTLVHTGIVLVTVLFTLGFCTRITSVLSWAGMLGYIHRSPTTVFGADAMMNILLIYLMIGPSGAALSLDRVLARWWARARPRVIGGWRAFWDRLLGRPPSSASILPGEMPPAEPPPLVSANFAMRLLQIHVCFIYLAAGLGKLQGGKWWDGTAVWYTLANYEFAPMGNALYVEAMRWLSQRRFLLEIVLTSGTAFTLVFEITYAFLIWGQRTRWVMLTMALMMHLFIALFMGLVSFALVMLVMNLAFLKPAEVKWALAWVGRWVNRWRQPAAPQPMPALAAAGPAPSLPVREPAPLGSGHGKFKK